MVSEDLDRLFQKLTDKQLGLLADRYDLPKDKRSRAEIIDAIDRLAGSIPLRADIISDLKYYAQSK